MAIKDTQQGRSWLEWPEPPDAPGGLPQERKPSWPPVGLHQFRQFLFFRQWQRLKEYANAKGIKIIGDIPIFVSADSADVWANPHLFPLDEECRERFVAGVPPDYFSETGQLWGNPHYDWAAMEKSGFAWWIARFRHVPARRHCALDHFRGFEAYWEIPAGSPNAIKGRWVQCGERRSMPCTLAFMDNCPRSALAGKIPVASTYGEFATGRPFDQIRQSIAYSEMNVKIFIFSTAG